jgi:hydrogenase maturation protein HypF
MISLRFHQALVRLLAEACVRIGEETGMRTIALSGGCFQNRFLTQRLSAALEAKGYTVFTHRLVPPNDGGLALGQVVVAAYTAS